MSEMSEAHAREIDELINQHQQRIQRGKMTGHEALAVMRECSKAISEACERHREELNRAPTD